MWHQITMAKYVGKISGTAQDGYSPGMVASLLGLSRQRVHKLIEADKLDCYRIVDKGQLRALVITDESLARLARERGITIPGLRFAATA